MRALNSSTPYRYSAVFLFQGDVLQNVCFIDKQNPEMGPCEDQPITDSYCIYVQQTQRAFKVEDSITDARVERHPKRSTFHCYYGVPLTTEDGVILGTVCHFDPMPISVTDEVATALDNVAPVIVEVITSVN